MDFRDLPWIYWRLQLLMIRLWVHSSGSISKNDPHNITDWHSLIISLACFSRWLPNHQSPSTWVSMQVVFQLVTAAKPDSVELEKTPIDLELRLLSFPIQGYQNQCYRIHVNLLCQTLKWLAGVRVTPNWGPSLASVLIPAHTSTHAASQDLANAGTYSYDPTARNSRNIVTTGHTSLTPQRGASRNGSQKVQSESKAWRERQQGAWAPLERSSV